MKVTVEELKSKLPPIKVTIEMGREEAFELREILETFGLRVVDQHDGAHAHWEGRPLGEVVNPEGTLIKFL